MKIVSADYPILSRSLDEERGCLVKAKGAFWAKEILSPQVKRDLDKFMG